MKKYWSEGQGLKKEPAAAGPQPSALSPRERSIKSEDFTLAAPPQPLEGDEIHLWFFPQWEKPRDATTSPALRSLLAAYLDATPAALRFERGEFGKPRVRADTPLEFNLSHAGNALLVALSRRIVLGVDLERTARRTRPVLELARRWFSPAEADALANLSAAQQQAAFLRLWTCKEAVLKCHGHGISYGLDRVTFKISAAGEVHDVRQAPAMGAPWQVRALCPAQAYVGAVAWCGNPATMRAFVTQAIAGSGQSG